MTPEQVLKFTEEWVQHAFTYNTPKGHRAPPYSCIMSGHGVEQNHPANHIHRRLVTAVRMVIFDGDSP